MKNGNKKSEKKSADYGVKKQLRGFGQVSMPKYNGQCKRAGTRDANEVHHK